VPRRKRSAPRFGVYRPTQQDAFLFQGTESADAGERLRVASWNIHFGAGSTLDDARRFPREQVEQNIQRIGEVLKRERVDIVALQEVDRDSQRSGHLDQLEMLRHATGLTHASFATTWDAAWVPYPVTAPPKQQYGRMWSGQAVLSRFPIVDQKRHGLAQPARNGRIFNRFYLHRCIQQVALDLGRGRTLSLLNVHLEAFDMANRRSQARAMARLMRRIGDHGLALGDLNTVAPEAELRHAFEDEPETDFRGDDTMATLRQTGWNEVGDQALTFPANKPNRRLDHIFSSPDLRTEGGGLMDEGGEPSSDHCPLLFEVQL
jgi:endonuclease/exonuclease/phosphatase family metal-dependent hydrolase